jgi:hypothetical protein
MCCTFSTYAHSRFHRGSTSSQSHFAFTPLPSRPCRAIATLTLCITRGDRAGTRGTRRSAIALPAPEVPVALATCLPSMLCRVTWRRTLDLRHGISVVCWSLDSEHSCHNRFAQLPVWSSSPTTLPCLLARSAGSSGAPHTRFRNTRLRATATSSSSPSSSHSSRAAAFTASIFRTWYVRDSSILTVAHIGHSRAAGCRSPSPPSSSFHLLSETGLSQHASSFCGIVLEYVTSGLIFLAS